MDCSRRDFVGMMAAGAGGLLGCGLTGVGGSRDGSARLTARPGNPSGTVTAGLNPLGLSQSRDGYLYVPASYKAGRPMPFLLVLHGAGIPAQGPLKLWTPYADSHGFLLLSVDSADYTWDAIRGSYGTDVAFIDSALRRAFGLVSVDPAHLAVSGFSDGASYALGLGLANGDLFRRTLAHSPGFIAASDSPPAGRTEFFFSHGVQDPILPIEYASRRIVPALKREGYSVTYVEFQGGHRVPPDIAAAAVTWFLR